MRDFIENHIPWLGDWLWGKCVKQTWMFAKEDMDFALGIRMGVIKEMGFPIEVRVVEHVAFDNGDPIKIHKGEAIFLSTMSKGLIASERFEKFTMRLERSYE